MQILLIGAGNMGSALYNAWRRKHKIKVLESNTARQNELKKRFKTIEFAEDNSCEGMVVVLAVKPQSIGSVKLIGKAKTLISIMAGVELSAIRSNFKAEHFVRAMPNMAALYGKSATALTGDIDAKEEAIDLFNLAGTAIWLESERELNIATALAGSGPGYLAVVAEAMANSAVKLGLKASDSHALTAALFNGMGALLTGNHPAILKEQISSPAGTTAAGIAKLEKHGVRHAFYDAVESAFNRAEELAGKKGKK